MVQQVSMFLYKLEKRHIEEAPYQHNIWNLSIKTDWFVMIKSPHRSYTNKTYEIYDTIILIDESVYLFSHLEPFWVLCHYIHVVYSCNKELAIRWGGRGGGVFKITMPW